MALKKVDGSPQRPTDQWESIATDDVYGYQGKGRNGAKYLRHH